MSDAFEHHVRQVMSGDARGVGPASARAAMRAAEPLYRAATRLRNRLYDRGALRGARLPRPVISIGNLTTGGTGKTPVVQWLVRRLVADGRRPAVLLRGYKRDEGSEAASDEELVLRESLAGVAVHANPDRAAAGRAAIADDAGLDAFVLDDGFQHRRLARDVDVVLIDATNPFGYGHVLPRGMLREPVEGIARAHVVIVTRARAATAQALAGIEATIRAANADAPIVRADATLDPPIDVNGDEQSTLGRRALAFSGIGNPLAFERGLRERGVDVVATRRFADHHRYADADVIALRLAAFDAGADVMLTTEKDWVKIRNVDPVGPGVATWRVGVRVAFLADGESIAWQAILGRSGLPFRSTKRAGSDETLWTE